MKRSKLLIGIGIVIASVLVSEICYWRHMADVIELNYYDIFHQLSGKRFNPNYTVIVTLDDETLLSHKNEPLVFWSPYFAKTIKKLRECGAAAIGIDFQFAVSAESWLDKLEIPESNMSISYDISMRTELNKGKVLLTGTMVKNSDGENNILLPVIDYIYSLPNGPKDIGLTNFYNDEDGVVRRFLGNITGLSEPPNLGFSYLLATQLKTEKPDVINYEKENTCKLMHIRFVGPPSTIPHISMNRFLKAGVLDPGLTKDEVNMIKNKIVIIAGSFSGSYDIHLTPYRGGNRMSGAELHANIVETILSGKFPEHVNGFCRMFWLIILITAGTFLFFKFSPLKSFIINIFLCFIACLAAYLLFQYNYIIPAASMQVGLSLAFISTLGFRLTGGEKEQQRIKQVLTPYISDALLTNVLSKASLPNLGGELYSVTVLISDIRSFTTISEKLNPQDVVELLNTYFTRVCEPIMKNDGMVDKFMGDAIMAIFGAPLSDPNHADKAIKSALEIKNIAYDFQKWIDNKLSQTGLPPFRIGIGLHSGEVVMANIGSKKRMSYTAIGDVVNTASRLESMSKTLGWNIVASEETLSLVKGGVLTGAVEEITPRGRSGKIKAYEVVGYSERHASDKQLMDL